VKDVVRRGVFHVRWSEASRDGCNTREIIGHVKKRRSRQETTAAATKTTTPPPLRHRALHVVPMYRVGIFMKGALRLLQML